MIRIAIVGSTAPMKVGAMKAALAALGLTAEVEARPARSGIREQPIGIAETRAGADNRAREARKAGEDAWIVGIESGLFHEEGRWMDRAVIVLFAPDGRRREHLTEGLEFPLEDFQEASRRGFETTTVGSVIAERTGCDKQDPHAYLTGGKKPRQAFLTETLIKLLREALPAQES